MKHQDILDSIIDIGAHRFAPMSMDSIDNNKLIKEFCQRNNCRKKCISIT